jgi:muconolactone delta-isomerase
MQQWMVRLTFKQPPDGAAMALVPAERARVDALMHEGRVTARYIAADNSCIWLVFSGEGQTEVESLIESLPMHALFAVELVPLAG